METNETQIRLSQTLKIQHAENALSSNEWVDRIPVKRSPVSIVRDRARQSQQSCENKLAAHRFPANCEKSWRVGHDQ